MISFSGIDGAGKSTQIDMLKKYYNETGKKYTTIWGRGGWTPGLELIKNMVRTDKKMDSKGREQYRLNVHKSTKKRKILLIGAILDLYLYFAVYYRYLSLFKREVICDRYIWDTYADWKVTYSEFNFEEWWIWKLLILIIPYPSKSFLFIISEKESIIRCSTKIDDTYESEEVKQRKIEIYTELINKNKWTQQLKKSRTSLK